MDGPLVLRGRARDLRSHDDRARTLGESSLDAVVDFMTDRRLTSIRTTPPVPGLADLVGRGVAAGFRGAVATLAPDLSPWSLLHLLVDDLPGTTLVSGYALSNAGAAHPRAGHAAARADICAGWRTGGTMLIGIDQLGRAPAVIGPAAPAILDPLDPAGWHPVDPLPPRSMRRWRRLDLMAGDPLRVDAMFRDSHVDADGDETVLHEYTLTATIDPSDGTILEIAADPRVLPWVECPAAAASSQDLVGQRVTELRKWVRSNLVGPETCTHLNDLLRSLADTGALAAVLVPGIDWGIA